MIRGVNDLEVYKLSLVNLKELYEFLRRAPKSEFDVIKNCKRAAKSIPVNLAEGWARRSHEAVFKYHVKISIGSSDEVVAHIETLFVTCPRLKNDGNRIVDEYIILSKRLNSLHKVWKSGTF
jgi:four helix bundle protein